MTKLDPSGVQFFHQELLEETNRQLAMFETRPPTEQMIREMGRIRLYEDRQKIQTHFFVCDPNVGAYESNHPQHGLLGRLIGADGSSSLIWSEIEGVRHSLITRVDTELIWRGDNPPDARLTLEARFKRKLNSEAAY